MKAEFSYKVTSRLLGYELDGNPKEIFTVYVYKGEKMNNIFQRLLGKPLQSPIWEKMEEYFGLDACKAGIRDDALHRYNRFYYRMNQGSYVPKEYCVWVTVQDGKVGDVILSDKL